MVDFETKCWGSVAHIFDGQVATSLLRVKAGTCCSIHFHSHRWNSFRVIRGKIVVVQYRHVVPCVEHCRHVLSTGQSIDIPPGVIHRFEVLEDGHVVEVYWTDDGSPVDIKDIQRFNEGGRL